MQALADLKLALDELHRVAGHLEPREYAGRSVRFRPTPEGLKLIAKWFDESSVSTPGDGIVQYPVLWVISWVKNGLQLEDLAELAMMED